MSPAGRQYDDTNRRTIRIGPGSVAASGGNTVEVHEVTEHASILTGIYVKTVTVGSVGAYTLTAARGTDAANMLSGASFDLTGLVADTWTSIPLNADANNLDMNALQGFVLSFVSDNSGLDAAGVYWYCTVEAVV